VRPDGEALSHAQRELLGGSFHANARLWPEHAPLLQRLALPAYAQAQGLDLG